MCAGGRGVVSRCSAEEMWRSSTRLALLLPEVHVHYFPPIPPSSLTLERGLPSPLACAHRLLTTQGVAPGNIWNAYFLLSVFCVFFFLIMYVMVLILEK